MIRRPPRSTLFPTRRSSDLGPAIHVADLPSSIHSAGENHSDNGDSSSRILPIAEMEKQSILTDRKSTRLNSSHSQISYAVFCLKKKQKNTDSSLRMSH